VSHVPFFQPTDYVLGLDLGQQLEFTALAILERTRVTAQKDERPQVHLAVRHLERWPLQTSYTRIITDLAARLKKLAPERPLIVVDRTGVGAAVSNMVRDAGLPARLLPVLITSGHSVSHPDGCTHLPKKELASVLQVLLQTGRLKVARSLSLAAVLEKDLASFKTTVAAAGKDAVESWREREHDDLVLAVALAAWAGDRIMHMAVPVQPLVGPRPSPVVRLQGKNRGRRLFPRR
jgi:hypothetical protein